MVANKADAAPAGAGADLAARLGVERLEGRAHRVQAASALSGSGVREGLQWLVEQARALSLGSEGRVLGVCLGVCLSGGQHAQAQARASCARSRRPAGDLAAAVPVPVVAAVLCCSPSPRCVSPAGAWQQRHVVGCVMWFKVG